MKFNAAQEASQQAIGPGGEGRPMALRAGGDTRSVNNLDSTGQGASLDEAGAAAVEGS